MAYFVEHKYFENERPNSDNYIVKNLFFFIDWRLEMYDVSSIKYEEFLILPHKFIQGDLTITLKNTPENKKLLDLFHDDIPLVYIDNYGTIHGFEHGFRAILPQKINITPMATVTYTLRSARSNEEPTLYINECI